jgi:hypothetical protein
MTYADIFNEVINTRFNGANVNSAKLWVNLRYGMVWGDRDWTFATGHASASVAIGSNAVSLPTDFGRVNAFLRSDGTPLVYLTPIDFDTTFYNVAVSTGTPDYYTVVNGQILVGPTSNVADTGYDLIYRKKFVKLVNDSDVPAIPEETHYMLVHGALATGLVIVNDFTWEFQEQAYQAILQSMRDGDTISDYGSTLQFQRDTSGLDTIRG